MNLNIRKMYECYFANGEVITEVWKIINAS